MNGYLCDTSPLPYRIVFIAVRCFVSSSLAFPKIKIKLPGINQLPYRVLLRHPSSFRRLRLIPSAASQGQTATSYDQKADLMPCCNFEDDLRSIKVFAINRSEKRRTQTHWCDKPRSNFEDVLLWELLSQTKGSEGMSLSLNREAKFSFGW